ncbi:MAG: hypothetical protein JXA87_09830 [Thermoleophilia bacterium]|nr:hypothetical protein [Thermoleophilia bacterium]
MKPASLSSTGLRWRCGGFVRPETTAEAYLHARVMHAIDIHTVVVFAVALLLTGLLYSLFTHWGFVKHWWVMVKWVVHLFQILFGALVLGPYTSENVSIAKSMAGSLSEHPQYFDNLDMSTVLGGVQLVLLLFVIFVSVWRPWGRVKRNGSRAAAAGTETQSA